MSGSGNGESARKGKGRQKVEMVKIENETNLQVTFSKRRSGLFKKASELSTLCGAETAVVVFSPGNKAHCFGHPNVDVVANRFLNRGNVAPMSDADKLVEARQQVTVNQQNRELAEIEKSLEVAQKRSRDLDKERKESGHRPEIEKLNFRQLVELRGALVELRHKVQAKAAKDVGTTSSSSNANSARLLLENNGTVIPYAPNEFGPIIPYSNGQHY